MDLISIPEKYLSGFKIIDNLAEQEISTINKVLMSIKPGAGFNTYFEKFTDELNDIEKAKEIALSIFSLGGLLIDNTSIDLLAQQLSKAFKSSTKKNNERFKNNIKSILEHSQNLKCTFKALEIYSENNKTFYSSRILSDIRFIFNDNLNDENRSAVILHQLKIEYTSNSKNKEIYLSLNTEDLKVLKETIERALEKEETIKTEYNTIPFIEIHE